MPLLAARLVAFALAVPCLCFAQSRIHAISPEKSDVSNVISEDAFARGNFKIDFERLGRLQYLNNYEGDTKLGHSSDVGFRINGTKFFIDHLGVGANLDGKWNGTHFNTNEYLTRRFAINPYIVYGMPISPVTGLYLQAGPEFGFGKTVSGSGSQNTSTSTHSLGFDAELGLPVSLGDGMYFTPDICYDYCSDNYPDYTVTRSNFGIGVHVGSYMPCGNYCSHGNAAALSGYYGGGNNFIDFGSRGSLRFGSSTEKPSNGAADIKQDLSHFRLNLTYGHYFANYFALGLDLEGSNEVQKNGSYKNSTSSYIMDPFVRFNLPFYPSFYLQGEYGWGWDKDVSTSSTTSGDVTNKDNFTNFGVYAGYNLGMTKKMSWNFQAGYYSEKLKVPNSTSDTKNRGFVFETGPTLSFR